MKLDIINFNPDINKDKEILKNLILIFSNIEQNISTKKYLPYQNILNKIIKFIKILEQGFEKDMQQVEEEKNYFDDTNDDDNISISSISEYEYEPSDDEIEIKIKEDELIENFETKNKMEFIKLNDRFDFEYD